MTSPKTFWKDFFQDFRVGDKIEVTWPYYHYKTNKGRIMGISTDPDGKRKLYWIMFDDGFGNLAVLKADLRLCRLESR